MEGTDQILDQITDPEITRNDVERNLASAGKRLANYFIDVIIFYVIVFVLAMVGGVLFGDELVDPLDDESVGTTFAMYFIFMGILLAYNVIMEAAFGKTIGKFITKTKVVTEDGQQPGVSNIVGRNLCRFIPFDAFSFLGSKAVGWHDSISKTRVING